MTIAATMTLEREEPRAAPRTRSVGLVSIVSGIAAIALLANHPGEAAQTFADVLKNEAANRLMDGVVHGGFIAVLALQLVCYSIFSARLGLSRAMTIAGLVFFAMGTAFMSASLLIDGLATPAIAMRNLAAPAKLEYAKSLFVLMGTLVGFLMPIGLMFQSAAIAAWGWATTASGQSRVAGMFGIVMGGLMIAALGANFAVMNPFVLMGAIAGTALWAIVVGGLLLRN